MSLMMEARKVQKVGYSTLIVSLPKDWVEEVSLKQGDIVTFRRESDGGITVYPGLTKERENHRYMIDADLCDGPNLLTRIITANYLTGHDTIQITSKKELSSRHLEEVRGVSRRLTGLGIVEQTLKSVTLQSFVDPTKFPIYGLMRRLQIILSSMLEQAVKSVVEGRMAMADEVLHMEEEADRIYWMIIRQLLLAVLDRRVAKEVGIEGPMHVVGNRVIAKSLEQMADSASHVALEAQKLKGDGKNVDTKITKGLLELSDKVRSLIEDSFNALMKGDVKKSNECIERVEACETLERSLTADLMKSVKDVNLAVGLRSIIWDVGQMARDSVSIAEVGINRKLETPSDFCQWEKV
ncbi:AbrB/MazE/SpoVT family DNA-binding domain-containing protein [Candidatus Bathyarchaeota archaeon]|nr:MAG: AbrB/MazE/SpoVT family DNA-binding domain-containing protein [Candidatus Bathyarchaeota archaeon]